MEVLCLLGAAGNELPGQPLAGCVHILTAFFLCSGDQLPEIGLAHFHPRLRRIPLFLQASRKAVAFRCPLFQLLIVGPHLLGVEFQAAEDILSGLFTQLRRAAGVSGGGYRLIECTADLLHHLPVSLGCVILSQSPELSHIVHGFADLRVIGQGFTAEAGGGVAGQLLTDSLEVLLRIGIVPPFPTGEGDPPDSRAFVQYLPEMGGSLRHHRVILEFVHPQPVL